jgi:hypothetical protein
VPRLGRRRGRSCGGPTARLERRGQCRCVVGLDDQSTAARQGLGETVDAGADDGHVEPHGQDGGLREGLVARRAGLHRRARDPGRGVSDPAAQTNDVLEAGLGDSRAQHRFEHPGAQDERRRRRGHPRDRLDKHVGALVEGQPTAEDDPRRGQPGRLHGAEALHGRHAAHHALLAHARPQDAGPGARAVRVEAVDAVGDLGRRSPPRLSGPDEVVVLAGCQGGSGRYGVRRRPPRAEHVRVRHVGAGQPRLQPGDELLIAAPLQVLRGAHELGLDVVGPGQRDPRVRCEPHQQARPMPTCGQRPRDAQEGELRAARLQLGDDPGDEHGRVNPRSDW